MNHPLRFSRLDYYQRAQRSVLCSTATCNIHTSWPVPRTEMSTRLRNNHRAAIDKLVALAPTSQAYGEELRTVLGIDECVTQRPIQTAIRQLLRSDEILMAVPMWQERRRLATGEIISAVGSPGIGQVHEFDWGTRIPGDSWPDDQVVAMALAYLYTYRRVIILSANRRGDRGGLRNLLHQEVKPALNRDLAHGLSLVLLLQRPKTSVAAYAHNLTQLVPQLGFTPGFREVKV